MKKIKKFLVKVCCLAVALCALVGNSVTVYAEDKPKPEYKLSISPSYEEMTGLKPGTTYSGEFTIFNDGLKDFGYSISFAPYTVTNENYEPVFTVENNYTEIKDWITVDSDSGDVEAGKGKKIHFTVEVPDDAHGGAQSAAILVTMKNSEKQSGNVEAVRQLGYLIYGNVDGEVTKTGRILENKVPTFLFNPPILASTLIENTGNVYTVATYKLQVFPLFSDEEVYTNEETPENNIIFPETKRYNELKWEGAPQLGIFKVRSTVKIFDEESVVEKMVFLCPIWFLFIVILIIVLIIFWIVSRIMKRKHDE